MLSFLLTMADEQYRERIERLYKRYHKPMLKIAKQRFVNALRSNPTLDAEDAVQAAFMGLVRYAHAVPFDRPRAELEAYVFTVLHHEISKILDQPEQTFEIDSRELLDQESLQDFGERLYIRDKYAQIVAFIRDMDPKYSTVLLLRYGNELTVEQIAKLTGLPQPTVYSRLRRGKQQLLEKFGKGESL
ncbi:MAG: sigma-70 family RNA polymerase sigma factor [Ruminococcaceae bacterium]|nr:sigma-70 family RNA polymerase sigma factor [Oscillospiraceae bacterium]